MSEHTKGTWVIQKSFWNGTKIISGDEEICTVHYIPRFFDEEDLKFCEEIKKANARLIAAAPEMLEVLEACLRISDLWPPVAQSEAEYEGSHLEAIALGKMSDNIKAAIAKATGKEKNEPRNHGDNHRPSRRPNQELKARG